MIEIKTANTNEEVKTEEKKETSEIVQGFIVGSTLTAAVAGFGAVAYTIGTFTGRHRSNRESRKYKKGLKEGEKVVTKYIRTMPY